MALRLLIAALLAGTVTMVQAESVMDGLRERALELVNTSRADEGLPTLTAGEDLNASAMAHAQDMLKRNYYSHTSPEGEGPRERYLEAGGSEWELVAENIAKCTSCQTPPDINRVEAFHKGWMNSAEHRANILRKGLSRFGFATASSDNVIYAVQTFAGPGTTRGDGTEALSVGDATEMALDQLNAARSKAGLPQIKASDTLTNSAASMLPEDLSGYRLKDLKGLSEIEGNWARLSAVAGACSGCGQELVAGDVRSFLSDWLSEGNPNRERLFDKNFTHAGFELLADGEGRKFGLLLLAE
ncbi:Cysteine-rich secretory protein family protein [Cohaesibacter sp. ES.047]|uniref:CAP domain-containing protein n=1 Tax=Cohaesibacter sp. ES.047 TaxID=1798205 RepID=UPI000BB92C95|nr:CAP domain-containing protein [Cohaesibacter sp. ES.047]SNY92291.1 Cysteine-rich secretory protein family protein [Cohaesibacter sp. ES.047]